ncbi:uncharacterized protein DS421_19g650200 [Arachis hypogaea]|uniref:Fe2OG dioxygenase domain-containing protein n=1 Tax=Arachis hypogaea TaxID=3818 RepID=A0A6B9V7D6_ARAHY|nr:uncharacterized protein DS421_19g650200 [Arachis hypogaea]
MMEADHEDGSYDRNKELKLLDETKAGVKGLVDAGLTKLPKIFVHDNHKVNISSSSFSATNVSIPVIDLESLHEEGNSRHEIIQKVKDAGEKWGFFQVVNRDIPPCVLDEMLDGVRRFHEQDAEGPLTVTNSLPFAELLWEALGLESSYLKDIDCAEGIFIFGHYYPPCPEPELTWGLNQIGRLQVFYENQWIDVAPIPGAFIINVGDMMQLITNDKFMSAKQRVLAQKVGPQVSTSCSLRKHVQDECPRMYGLIKELVIEENPPIYKEIKMLDLIKLAYTKKLDDDVSRHRIRWSRNLWTT